MKFRTVAVLGLALCCAALPASAAPSPGFAGLTAQAEALYQQAAAYIAHAPVTFAQGNTILDPQSPYMQWMAAEKRFEQSLADAGKAGVISPLQGSEWIQIAVWLGYGVNAAGLWCDAPTARVDLPVARQYLEDASAGSPLFLDPHGNWQPAGYEAALARMRYQTSHCIR